MHGIFSDNVDKTLIDAGLSALITTNTIVHSSNSVDISPLLVEPIMAFLSRIEGEK